MPTSGAASSDFKRVFADTFFLATKEIEIRDVKGKRDTQRKGCYPHAPDPIIEPVNATISFHDANGRMEGI